MKNQKIGKNIYSYYICIPIIIMYGIFLLPKVAYLSTVETNNILNLINNERVTKDLNSLKINDTLSLAAENKANDIFSSQLFQHNLNNKKFSTWVKELNYEYFYLGENLAIDFVTSEKLFSAWKNSESHYKNIINPYYKEVGISISSGLFENSQSNLVVAIFAAPTTITPVSSIKTNNINNTSYLYTNHISSANIQNWGSVEQYITAGINPIQEKKFSLVKMVSTISTHLLVNYYLLIITSFILILSFFGNIKTFNNTLKVN